MSIYQSVTEYAKTTNITEEQAKIRCEHFLALEKKAEVKRICPDCKQATLVFEGGCSEMGHGDYIYCENDKVPYTDDGEEVLGDCEFTSNDAGEYEEIMPYYNFDVVLAMAIDIEESKKNGTEIGLSLGQDRQSFVEQDNSKLALQ